MIKSLELKYYSRTGVQYMLSKTIQRLLRETNVVCWTKHL